MMGNERTVGMTNKDGVVWFLDIGYHPPTMPGTSPKRYRANAAVIVTDGAGRVLLCHRVKIYEALQTVQGGIDPGETPRQAAERELKEELGIKDGEFEFIAEMPGTCRYDWPDEYILNLGSKNHYDGQEQSFFLARVSPDAVFDLDAHFREFAKVSWGTAEELIAGCWPPKRPCFVAALTAFGLI